MSRTLLTRRFLLASWALTSLLFLGQVQAQGNDPLWLKAVAHAETTKGLFAGEVQARIETSDKEGKLQESVEKKSKLTAWKDGKPVRETTSTSQGKKSDSSEANSDIALADSPDDFLNGITKVQRVEELALDGRSAVVFQVSGEKLKKDKKLPFSGKVWVDKEASAVTKLELIFDPSNVPMTKKMSQQIVLAPNKDGLWLPKSTVIDLTVSVVFTQVKIAMRYGFESWVKRP